MKTKEVALDILKQYEKFGWKLEKILATEKTKSELADSFEPEIFADSDLDAMWFSRESNEGVTWELRRLSETPYAVLEFLNDDAEENARKVESGEERLRQTVQASKKGH